jgi:GntR family transcriptional regulator, arabinose operon transcriptional repressor
VPAVDFTSIDSMPRIYWTSGLSIIILAMFMNKILGKKLERARGLVDRLRESVLSEALQPGDFVGSESAFAKKWGLARTTVRRAVDSLINEGLLERRAGKGLFVRLPSSIARLVQVVVPNIAWAHAQEISRGAQQAGEQLGILTQIYDAHGRMELDLEVVRRLPDRHIDGAIIVSLHHPRFSEVLFELKSVGFPFVLVDQRLRELDVPTIDIDDYRGGYIIGKKLCELGHQRIVFTGSLSIQALNLRLAGFRDAMLDARVLFDRSLVIDLGGEGLNDFQNNYLESTTEAILPVLTRPDPPTAIFDASGGSASYFFSAAQQAGLRVPEDLSIVTFEQSAYFRMNQPEDSGLFQQWNEMGKIALEMLIREMDGRGASVRGREYEHQVVQARWMDGKSLAPPRAPGSMQRI